MTGNSPSVSNHVGRQAVRARHRPACRVALAFVWGDADCDTDGNSHNPASRVRTELDAPNRGRTDEAFSNIPASVEPLVLQVKSEHEWLDGAVATCWLRPPGAGCRSGRLGLSGRPSRAMLRAARST
jgi:hypothetical protein